jgi:phosphohistidine phosphatase
MNLYLVRHAEALPLGPEAARDADRPLSARGEHAATMIGRVLAACEPAVQRIATSPLKRARRTAELIAGQFPQPPDVDAWRTLEPGVDMDALLDEIKEQADAPLVVVAHQPDLTEFLSWLVAEASVEIAFPPGTVAALNLAGDARSNGARLHWVLTPALVSLLHPEW